MFCDGLTVEIVSTKIRVRILKKFSHSLTTDDSLTARMEEDGIRGIIKGKNNAYSRMLFFSTMLSFFLMPFPQMREFSLFHPTQKVAHIQE
jgi:hypothetical protein